MWFYGKDLSFWSFSVQEYFLGWFVGISHVQCRPVFIISSLSIWYLGVIDLVAARVQRHTRRANWHSWCADVESQGVREIVERCDIIFIFFFYNMKLWICLKLVQKLIEIIHLVKRDWLVYIRVSLGLRQCLWMNWQDFWLLLCWYWLILMISWLSWQLFALSARSFRGQSCDVLPWIVLRIQALVYHYSTNSFGYSFVLLLSKCTIEIFDVHIIRYCWFTSHFGFSARIDKVLNAMHILWVVVPLALPRRWLVRSLGKRSKRKMHVVWSHKALLLTRWIPSYRIIHLLLSLSLILLFLQLEEFLLELLIQLLHFSICHFV